MIEVLRAKCSEHLLQAALSQIDSEAQRRRVSVAAGAKEWTEVACNLGDDVSVCFQTGSVIQEASKLFRLNLSAMMPIYWANEYQNGEAIERHVDFDGALQILLCIVSAEPECGGHFVAEISGERRSFALKPRDFLAFRATEIYHSTTPIVCRCKGSSCRRVVAVCRFLR